MSDPIFSIFLWPFYWKTVQMLIVALLLLPVGLSVYGIYSLIIWKMSGRVKSIFHRILLIVGISAGVLFFVQGALTLITQHHVNVQLGFRTATPETSEGEAFIVSRVEAGKTMDSCGLLENDTIRMYADTHLYKLLINNQGKEANIPLIRDNKEIEITVAIPEMDLPLIKYTLLF